MPDDLPPTTPRAPADPAPPASADATADFEPAVRDATPADSLQTNPSGEVARAGGMTLPGYDVLGQLGAGGMGVVYHARDRRLGREVAVKMVLGDRPDPQGLVRFQVEAQAVAAVRHPNVVQVYESGDHDGRPYMVLEYCAGGSLADRLRGGAKLAPAAAADLLRRIAEGVAAVHAVGIVHRDLKPANILFGGEGGDTPKVADFGLARRGTGAGLTQTLALMGTPQYMSPEQAEFRARFVGPPADVWALGVILYECLAGARPFHADTAEAVLSRVLADSPAPLRPQVAGLHPDLARIVDKCLEKNPADRYPTAAELAAELGRYGRGEPLSVRPLGRVERAIRWSRRKPTLAAAYALGAVAVTLGAVAAGAVGLWRTAVAARAVAEEERREADQERGRADAERAKAEQVGADLQLSNQLLRDAQRRVELLNATVRYANLVQLAYQEQINHNYERSQARLDACPPHLRGWEWHHLNRHAHRDMLRLDPADASSVAVAPDLTRYAAVVTKGDRTHLAVWRSGVAAEVARFTPDHQFSVGYLKPAWSPDGKRLAHGSQPATVQVWEPDTNAVVTLRGHWDDVTCVAWSPDGRTLATGASDRSVRLWDTATGRERAVLYGHDGTVTQLAWHPEQPFLLSGSADATARVWFAVNGTEVAAFRGHSGPIASLAWNPSTGHVLTTSQGSETGLPTARVWEAETGRELAAWGWERDFVTAACWGAGGDEVVLGTGNGELRLVSVETGEVRARTEFQAVSVTSLAVDRGTGRLAVSTSNDLIRCWERADLMSVLSAEAFHPPSSDGMTLEWAEGGTTLVCDPNRAPVVLVRPFLRPEPERPRGRADLIDSLQSPAEPLVRVTQTTGQALAVHIDWEKRFPLSLAKRTAGGLSRYSSGWDPTGRRFASGDTRRPSVDIWSAGSGAKLADIPLGKHGPAWFVAWRPDGGALAVAVEKGSILVFGPTGERLAEVHAAEWSQCAWSPDGKHLLVTSSEAPVIWEVSPVRRRHVLATQAGGSAGTGCWSPDGRRIAVAGNDRAVRVWDADTGREVLDLRGHSDYVRSCDWSPDGSRLVTGGMDGTVRVWDTASGIELLTIQGGREACWSADGTQLLTLGTDGRNRVLSSAPVGGRPGERPAAPAPRAVGP
ncbi:MAG: protein kinase [Gemmataceae bacterium]